MKKKLIYLAILTSLSGPAFAGKAKLLNEHAKNKVPDQYIVVLKDLYVAEYGAKDMARQYSGKLKNVYKKALNGFAIKLNKNQLERLREDPRVDYIEQDQTVTLSGSQSPVTWGLDRIDQRNLPLNNTYNYDNSGTGVNAYVIDTGILTSHSNFSGRAFSGWDFIDNDSIANDCNGHGTHVAGTIGSNTYGVAKGVKLYGVKVLNCAGGGTNSSVIAGIDWVRTNHIKPAVANISIHGPHSTTINNATNNLSNIGGVTVVVAAGNWAVDACTVSPASATNAITVGSTTLTDARSSFSNFGTCLDIFAPGSSITSTWSNGGTNTINGTSMAAPHVAGVAALHLESHANDTPAQVTSAILNNTTLGKVTNAGTGSPNKLLYSIVEQPSTEPPTMDYVKGQMVSCNGPQYLIQWKANPGGPILEYDVDYKVAYSSSWINFYNGTQTSKYLSGPNELGLLLRARARNSNGWSSYYHNLAEMSDCGGGGGGIFN